MHTHTHTHAVKCMCTQTQADYTHTHAHTNAHTRCWHTTACFLLTWWASTLTGSSNSFLLHSISSPSPKATANLRSSSNQASWVTDTGTRVKKWFHMPQETNDPYQTMSAELSTLEAVWTDGFIYHEKVRISARPCQQNHQHWEQYE